MSLHRENLLRLKCDICGEVKEFVDPPYDDNRAGGVIQAMALAGWDCCSPGPMHMGGGKTLCAKHNAERKKQYGD